MGTDKKAQQRQAAKAAKEEAKAANSDQASPQKNATWLQQARKRPGVMLLSLIVVPVLVALLGPGGKFRVVPIERVALSDLSLERFLNEFANKKPVIVTGAWDEDGWRPDEVVDTCPHAVVRTMKHDEGSKSWALKTQVGEVPLREYYEAFFKPEPSQRPHPLLYGFEMTLSTYCPKMLEKMKLPAMFTEDAFHIVTNSVGIGWPSVFFGPKDSETGLHIDTHRLPFWLVSTGASGKPLKRFRAFPHTDMMLMKYGKPEQGTNFHFFFNAWSPDFRKYPLISESFVYETDLHSGELLYVPGGAPHAAFNLEDNMACSMNYMDLATMPDFARKCQGNSPLCALIQGKGTGVLDGLTERRKQAKSMSYFEFAGFNNSQQFCAGHKADPKHQPSKAFDEYCA